MNDIKSSERSSMGQQNLKNLMLWHIMGHKMNADGMKEEMRCCDVPVMAILKEFCALAGINGRRTHRPTMPPSYDFKVKVELDSKPAAGAPAPAVAPA